MRTEEIETRAGEMGVDLSLPYARAYVVACLESEEDRPYVECEPRDASGFTGAVSILRLGVTG